MRRRRNLWAAMLGMVLVTCTICPGGPREIWADEQPTVAVLDAPKIQPVLIRALARSGQYRILPPAKWDATARQLNAMGHAADEIAVVATELKVGAVVTTSVKRDKDSGQWTLIISARYGPTGKIVDRLKYPLKTQRVDKATLAQAAGEIAAIVDKAIKGPQEAPQVAQEQQPDLIAPGTKVEEPGREDEDPLKRMAKAEEEEKRRQTSVRPKWYPYIDAGVGVGIEGRNFNVNQNPACYDLAPLSTNGNPPAQPTLAPGPGQTGTQVSYVYNERVPCAGFRTSAAPMVRLDATVFPLAWVGINPLRGLGVGVTADFPIWAPSKDQSGNTLATNELRIEAGLRWAWNILNRRDRPSLLVMLQYGLHSFTIQKVQTTEAATDQNGNTQMVQFSDDHGQPDIQYQYFDIAAGGRFPWLVTAKHYFASLIDFHYHVMLKYGQIASAFTTGDTNLQDLYLSSGYGPVSGGYGLRVGLTPLEWMPWKGLTLRATGYYELFSMNFSLANPSLAAPTSCPSGGTTCAYLPTAGLAARHLAQSATDQYFGVLGQVGWQY